MSLTKINFPEEFDPAYYGANNADLRSFDTKRLSEHYLQHGRGEGRKARAFSPRTHLSAILEGARDILEIGPFNSPVLVGPNVEYFDVLSREDLIARAEKLRITTERIPRINYVSPIGDLSVVDKTFEVVFSSHCLEHQVDLIGHLQQVDVLLEKGGAYPLFVPDKRFCFDARLAESTIADILDAHHEKRKFHRLASVLEHRALTVHNDTSRHWQEREQVPQTRVAERLRAALLEFEANEGSYIDVHAWKFTPESFHENMNYLRELGLINFVVERLYYPEKGYNEFFAVLRKTE